MHIRRRRAVGRHDASDYGLRGAEDGAGADHPDLADRRHQADHPPGVAQVAPWLKAYFTPAEHHSPEMKEALRLSDELVAKLIANDHVVIATPIYNYHLPAVLRAWIDHIVRKGLTLGFDGKGLLHGKTSTVLMASGGIYTDGSPIRDRDIATQYLRLILKVMGINDVTIIAAGGAKGVDLSRVTREAFLERLDSEIELAGA
ncbi:MAG: FMN-dependent NADH-azoreductase [Alphaproteobacteria bacterium]|nr:MAG: FMN-dependent NADH-azoreductase [Alphaproteobacteria bacterium]